MTSVLVSPVSAHFMLCPNDCVLLFVPSVFSLVFVTSSSLSLPLVLSLSFCLDSCPPSSECFCKHCTTFLLLSVFIPSRYNNSNLRMWLHDVVCHISTMQDKNRHVVKKKKKKKLFSVGLKGKQCWNTTGNHEM